MGELCDWSQLAYLLVEDTSSQVGGVENRAEGDALAKWAPHLALKPTLLKHSLVPEVKGKPKYLHLTVP